MGPLQRVAATDLAGHDGRAGDRRGPAQKKIALRVRDPGGVMRRAPASAAFFLAHPRDRVPPGRAGLIRFDTNRCEGAIENDSYSIYRASGCRQPVTFRAGPVRALPFLVVSPAAMAVGTGCAFEVS